MEKANGKNLYNIGVISLGCDKNRVNTEKMLYRVKSYGHNIVNDIKLADIVIINTCAFLQAAREESINAVLETSSETGGKPVIVTGCLPQKYIGELYPKLTEAVCFLGTNDYGSILEAIARAAKGVRYNGVNSGKKDGFCGGRIITTKNHYAFLMVADGCDNYCSYCLIPSIRGRYRSEKKEDIISEAKSLVAGGVKELLLVAQDTTRYGRDIYGEYSLVSLLRELSRIEGLNKNSIRLLYCYPELVTDALIEEIKDNEKIIKYIDIPLQHISDRILKDMKRRSNSKEIKALIKKLREKIPGISIRSTFIVGFPGETQEDFDTLCAFLKEYGLDNAGFFAYSREKGTAAYNFQGQVHYRTKQKRLEQVNLIQQDIYYKKNAEMMGKTLEVVCDGFDSEKNSYFGRTYQSAPLSDRLVYFTSEKEVKEGALCRVAARDFDVYDIYGEAEI